MARATLFAWQANRKYRHFSDARRRPGRFNIRRGRSTGRQRNRYTAHPAEMEGDSVYQEVVDFPTTKSNKSTSRNPSDPVAAADAWIEEHLWETIAWDAFPLFQYTLIKLGARRHIWLQKYNHLVIDGMGRQLLVKRTSEIYEALRKKRQPNAAGGATAAQLVAVNAQYLASEAREQDLGYFHKKFEHLSPSLIRNDFRHSEKTNTGRSTRIIKQISSARI